MHRRREDFELQERTEDLCGLKRGYAVGNAANTGEGSKQGSQTKGEERVKEKTLKETSLRIFRRTKEEAVRESTARRKQVKPSNTVSVPAGTGRHCRLRTLRSACLAPHGTSWGRSLRQRAVGRRGLGLVDSGVVKPGDTNMGLEREAGARETVLE